MSREREGGAVKVTHIVDSIGLGGTDLVCSCGASVPPGDWFCRVPEPVDGSVEPTIPTVPTIPGTVGMAGTV